MKNVVIFLLVVLAGLSACQNFNIDHPDNPIGTAGYFPYQYPVRTLILGDYIYDNANDNAYKFVISVAMGGVYENTKDRKFTILRDDALCVKADFNAVGGVSGSIKPLPSNYLASDLPSEIIIPKGKYDGGITVQLTEAFFNDPDAIKRTYVIPLRLVSSNDVDSILCGLPLTSNPNTDPSDTRPFPDVRRADHWTTVPKNFTMFGVKFINEYHATYFQYGKCEVGNADGKVGNTEEYKQKYIEWNPTVTMVTSSRRGVSATLLFKSNEMPAGSSFNLTLTFDSNNSCTISGTNEFSRTVEGVTYTTVFKTTGVGTGTFVSKQKDAYTAWGNKDRDVINNVNYRVVVESTDDPDVDPSLFYSAEETLVVRTRDVLLETFTPVILN